MVWMDRCMVWMDIMYDVDGQIYGVEGQMYRVDGQMYGVDGEIYARLKITLLCHQIHSWQNVHHMSLANFACFKTQRAAVVNRCNIRSYT